MTLKQFGTADHELRVTLGDTNRDVASALAGAFHDVGSVEVVLGSLLDVATDAVVCPGNSFGDMGGGFDKAVDDLHGGQAQDAVRAAIASRYLGELPVGVALIVRLRAPRRAPFLVVAPTMRVPGNVGGSIGAYLAMRAALVAVCQHNAHADAPIRSIAIPGMCTGVGGMEYAEAASQMRSAFDNVVAGGWREVVHPALAPYAVHPTSDRRRPG